MLGMLVTNHVLLQNTVKRTQGAQAVGYPEGCANRGVCTHWGVT